MPFTEKRLAGPTQLTTSAVAIYTVPANRTTIVKQLVATNTSASAATFTLYIGTATAANAVFNATSVAANDSLVINLSQVLATGEVLRALASANTAINLTISGVENDGPLTPTATYIADGAVTSAKIADGTIVNADINASAAIDKTKISGTAITAADTGTVTSTMILDGTIATADLANNAVTQSKLSTDVPLSGMRNILINGDFRIWQRGVGPTATSTGIGQGYLADRWNCARGGYATGGTVSRQSAGLTGFQFCSRVQRTNGNTSTALFYYYQTLETSNSLPFAGQQATYSFYARAGSTFTGSILARLLGGTATDQLNYPDSAITGGSAVVSQNITLTASWQRFTFTGTVGATVTQLFAGFEWTPSGTAGANDFFEITGVQLEIGPQATPFEQRLIDVEIQLCQRYFSKSFQLATAPVNNNGTGDNSGNNLVVWAPTVGNSYSAAIHFPVRMRRTPDVTLYNSENATANTWSVYNSTTSINNAYSVIIGTRNERSMLIYAAGITTITVSNGAWAASAEL